MLTLVLSVALVSVQAKTQMLAHRGSKFEAPENTLSAIAAGSKFAQYVELDVQMTKDGHLVVIHDETVDRTTNGTGRVADLTLAEIRELDAGRKFSEKFAGEKVPMLHEALATAKRYGVGAFLDVKNCSPVAISREIQNAEAIQAVVVSSADRSFLKEVHGLLPKVALCYQGVTFLPPEEFKAYVEQLKRLGVKFVLWNEKGLTRGILRAYQQQRIKVFVWYSTDLGEVVRLMSEGVDGVLCDDPEGIRNILK